MICIPIVARDTEEALPKIARACTLADVVELRLDGMESFRVEPMIRAASRPVMVTFRSRKEGGRGTAYEETRTGHLLEAVRSGAAFADVEYGMRMEHRQAIIRSKGQAKVVLSAHFPGETPSRKKLERLLRNMAAEGADVVKIVTRAEVPQDNLSVLSLIPMACDLGVKIVALCMGTVGRISRVASVLLGGYMTFASLEEGEESADGQIPAAEMKRILAVFA